jgi:hypothetical protein
MYMAKFKGATSDVYPSHENAAKAFGATLRKGSKFTTYAVKEGPTGLWLTDYHADLPKAWIVKQGQVEPL